MITLEDIPSRRGHARYEMTTVRDARKILCDICLSNCTPEGYCDSEYAVLFAAWGYDSKRDCSTTECHMCEKCYEKVKAFIESLGGEVPEYDSFG